MYRAIFMTIIIGSHLLAGCGNDSVFEQLNNKNKINKNEVEEYLSYIEDDTEVKDEEASPQYGALFTECEFEVGEIKCKPISDNILSDEVKGIILYDTDDRTIEFEQFVEDGMLSIKFSEKIKIKKLKINATEYLSDEVSLVRDVTYFNIYINDSMTFTTTRSVELTLEAFGASQMYITNTPGCETDGRWEAFATNKNWKIKQSNANATVYVKYKNESGRESLCISDSIIHDNREPFKTSISINNDDDLSYSTAVTLTITAQEASEMYVTNDKGCVHGGKWEVYSESKNWTLGEILTSTDVYVKFRDEAGNESDCVSDTITHDGFAPSALGLEINQQAAWTNSTSVTLSIKASEYANEMYISNTPGCTENGSWDPFTETRSDWILEKTNDISSVFIKFRDLNLNESNCIDASIVHDDIAPTLPIVSDGRYAPSVNDSPLISWTESSDSGSGVKHYEVGIGTIPFENDIKELENVGNLLAMSFSGLTLDPGMVYYVNVKVTDIAGNISHAASEGFTYHYCYTVGDPGSWIPVPLDADEFCVMKYEAKDGGSTPVSKPYGIPWVTTQSSAKNACAAAGYQLISNTQWMALTTDISTVPSNWTSGLVGVGLLIKGHSDAGPNQTCEANANDDLAYVDGSVCSGSSIGDLSQRRTHLLSNGEVIWDISGNISEFVDLSLNQGDQPDSDGFVDYPVTETLAMPLTSLIPQEAIANNWDATFGIGQYQEGPSYTAGRLTRGGSYNDQARAGVFYANFFNRTYDTAGFRCIIQVP